MARERVPPLRSQRRNTILDRPLQQWSDGELLQRFAIRHDEQAFAILVERHGPMVLATCRRILDQDQDAEDAFQATFLVLARKAWSIQRQQSLASWLYKVAYRIALRSRAAKAQQRRREAHFRQNQVADPPGQPSHDLRPLVDEEVQLLPEKYRTPVVLCYWQGRTSAEAAEMLRCPPGTIKVRLVRAREILRKRLLRRGIGVSVGVLLSPMANQAQAAVPVPLIGQTVSSCIAAGTRAGRSPQVHLLVNGLLRAMGWAKLKLAGALLLTVALLACTNYLSQQSRAAAPRPVSVPLLAPLTPQPSLSPVPQYEGSEPVKVLVQAREKRASGYRCDSALGATGKTRRGGEVNSPRGGFLGK